MARFFVPNMFYKPRAGNDISPDVIYELNKALPSDAVVCVGFTAGRREVDLAIFTNVAVHVIESKDYYNFPVRFFKNQGLQIQDEAGNWNPIVNDRGKGEYVNVQAQKNAGAVNFECKANNIMLKVFGYILIPHAHIDSDVSENGDVTRISLSVKDLLNSIKQREEIIIDQGNQHHYSETQFVDIAQRVFGLHETDTISGYKIGDFPPTFVPGKQGNYSTDSKAYYFGKEFQQTTNRFTTTLSEVFSVKIIRLIKILIVLGSILSFIGIVGFMLLGGIGASLQTMRFTNIMPIFWTVGLVGSLLVSVAFGVIFFRIISWIVKKYIVQDENKSEKTEKQSEETAQPLPTLVKTSLEEVQPPELNDQENLVPPPVPIIVPPIPDTFHKSPIQGGVSSRTFIQKYWYLFGVAAIAFILILLLVSGIGSQQGCIRVTNLNVRSEPMGEVIGKLEKDSCLKFNAISSDRSWVRISSLSNRNNWVSVDYVEGLKVSELKIVK